VDLGSPNARRELAALFTTFCDGVEEAGMTRYAQIGRTVADELRRCADELVAERSARVTIQAARDRSLAILANQAGKAAA